MKKQLSMEPNALGTCLICVEGVTRVLDELIRAALNEAASEIVVPNSVDQDIWSSILQAAEPVSEGASNES